MEEKILQQFHQSISDHRNLLQKWINSDKARVSPVIGDASVKEVLDVITELKQLLEQIDKNEFGKCNVCHADVEEERLEQDYTTNVCLDCYSEEELRALERDLELAAKVQQQLLPACAPVMDSVEIAVRNQSASVVGGDYYDFFILKNGHQGIAIGDVMGKGLPASMLMSNLQASLRILAPDYDQLHQLTARLNRLFRYNLKLIKFISLFLAAIDTKTRQFFYCNAGHHSPLWWKAINRSVHWLKPTAPAIGLIPDSRFISKTIQPEPDDIILLYTDGLIEARAPDGEEYGERRMTTFIQKNNHQSAERILQDLWEDVIAFAGKFSDDITAMMIKFL